MTPETITLILTPLVVWGVTELIKYITQIVSSQIILFVIVPVVSLLIAFLGTLTGLSELWLQSLVGLTSVGLNEFLKHFKK